ncbi:MAG: cyclic nucleotide-binding domain-containing protein [candidate division Zixibacteria bacterium]|nr:cyclic nucleotide-binding domain-containing protein [candidate division Zixibacteria bacterium]
MVVNNLHCQTCGFKQDSLFCGLAAQLLDNLDKAKSAVEYKPGQIIFYEGSPPLAIYCIKSGSVKLYKTGGKGEEQVIRLLGPGDIIGYRALLSQEPFAATAETITKSVICTIPKDMLLEILRKSPEQNLRLLKKLSVELRISEELLLSRTQESVLQRTARFLLFFSQGISHSEGENRPLSIPLKRKDLAQLIGTSPETLSRTLKELASRQILMVNRTQIVIKNQEALQKIISRFKKN